MSAMLRVELFVPREPVEPVLALKAKILQEVGGFTDMHGTGAWLSGAGKLIEEGVFVLLFFVEDTEDNRLWVEAIAREYKEDAEQECVLYVLNGNDAVFIDD